MIAKTFYSGFELAHDTYNAISVGSDQKVYYILSSESISTGGQMYVFDPLTEKIEHLGDLSEICGEKGLKAVPQGKSHVDFEEHQGKLYFATHVGFYETIEGMERLPVHPPDGFQVYPGGHFIAYDLASQRFEDLSVIPEGEGVLTMGMDKEREVLYAISWPNAYFIKYDIKKNKLTQYHRISARGEAGIPGDDYRVICRSLYVEPQSGKVYFSNAEGDILYYSPENDSIKKMEDVSLRLDYFGTYETNRPGSMGYNWRKIFWHPEEEVAYGVHGNSGYLFRFKPRPPSVEIVDRITSEPSRKSGMFDQFSYGYLGFQLAPDGETIYYLTGGPVYQNGKRVEGEKNIAKGAAKGLENLHLVTFHIPTQTYQDHGAIFYENGERPTYVNAIAVGKDGFVYTLARFMHEGTMIQDLIRIPDPLYTMK